MPEPLEAAYRRLHESSEGRIVVGTLDDVVLGYAVGEVEALADGRRLGRVHEVFVDEGARGVGLGEAILGDLVAWFTERGCVGIDAPALPGHRQAKNFFEGHGFVARLLVMHHRTAGAGAEPAGGGVRPEVAVGGVVVRDGPDGRPADLLLVERGRGAGVGRWSVPGRARRTGASRPPTPSCARWPRRPAWPCGSTASWAGSSASTPRAAGTT